MLDLVIEHLGIGGPAADGIPSDVLAEIDRCIWSDRRAEAIKLYREATGRPAVEAKAWVDQRAASY
jgi:ribosomal protein L7/L12